MKALKKALCTAGAFQRLALLLAIALLLTAAVGTSLSFIVTNTPSLYNLFISGLNPTGDLVIRKTVEHPLGDDYIIPEGIAFNFAVDLGTENAGKTFDGWTADENGVLLVAVKANSAVTVHGIAAGTEVTVTERQEAPGFSPKEGAVKEASIEKGKSSTIEFINTYTPEQAQAAGLTVHGTKELVGRDWQEGDSFTFQLALYENGSWTGLGTETVTYRLVEIEDPENPGQTVLAPKPGFNQFDFTELVQRVAFDKAGTYSFRVTEVDGSVGGITYDQAESFFDILVGDTDMDGCLEIQGVTTSSANTQITQDEDANYGVAVIFQNRYAPAGSAEANIHITKTLNDTSGQNMAPAGFVFELYGEDGNLCAASEATPATGEGSIRLIFEPEDAGKTFTYTLKEANGGQTIHGMTYDSTETKIQISVVDNLDGTVSAFVYDDQDPPAQEAGPETTVGQPAVSDSLEETSEPVSDNNENALIDVPDEPEAASEGKTNIPEGASSVYAAAFRNTYDPQDARISISGDKDLTGRAMKAGEFRFNLYACGSDFAITENAVPVDSVVNSDENGSFLFDVLTFSKVGTYYYAVTEDASTQLGGVSYDTSKYLVTVRVTDSGGALAAAVKITNESGEESEIKFLNTYSAAKAIVTLTGKKTLIGRTLAENEFTFELYQANDAFKPIGAALQAVKNNGSGGFSFADLSFAEEGTWHYLVKENTATPAAGVVYDGTEYHVTVTVTDDGTGALIPAVDMTACRNQEQTSAETIRFENRYSAANATLSLGGEKILEGAALEGSMFTFHLYEADEHYTPQGSAVRCAKNNADGEFIFSALTFESEGTYYYIITEDASAQDEHITYDASVYGVMVQVRDDGSGQLKAVSTVTKDGKQVDTVRFVNTYTPAPNDAVVDIAVKKAVDNIGTETIGPEGFTFILTNLETGARSTAVSNKNGLAGFTLTFTNDDVNQTYHYRLEEAAGNQAGVTYSDTIYDFEITVLPAENGKLSASVTYNGETVEQFTAEFVNTYAGGTVPPSNPKPGTDTGDNSKILLYAALLTVSGVVLILLLVISKCRKRKNA